MSQPSVIWTPQQTTAITQRGRDLLVTASAGTGKTAVLSERCLDILCEPGTKTSVLNMLILTFTDAAAEEMRTRIRAQLTEAAARDRRLCHLQRELLLLPAARISTIHSFCKHVITEHFHTLGLDPGFRLIDTDEQHLLKTEALEQTLNWAWDQPDLQAGLRVLFHKRTLSPTRGFALKIMGLSDDLDNVLSRDRWYANAFALAKSSASIDGPVADRQKEWVGEQFMVMHVKFTAVIKDYREACTSDKPKPLSNQKLLASLELCICGEQGDDWDAVIDAYHAFEKQNVLKPKDVDPDVALRLQNRVREVVTAFTALGDLAVPQSDYFERLEPRTCVQTETLLTLTQAFERFYTEAKHRINCLDFSDLEHQTLRLLVHIDSDTGRTSPTSTALSLRTQFHHVFVDEYQDVNPVQEAIIEALHDGRNLFVVGDIKQSIYAFRGARPGIFQARLNQVRDGGSSNAQRVDLNTNFRSFQGVLDATNRICQALMTEETCAMDYDEAACLSPPTPVAQADVCVECHLLDEQQAPDSDANETDHGPLVTHDVSSRERQAAMIAQRILDMTGQGADHQTGQAEFQVFDKALGQMRDVAYRDMAILFRSPAKRVDDYIKVLRLAGIPVSSSQSAGYFEATEIRDCINVLQVLDNPQRDIELAAVLRGPFFNVSDNDLVRIRLASQTKPLKGFYDRVMYYTEQGDNVPLVERLRAIMAGLAQWRHMAGEGSLAHLIWTLIRQTGLLSAVQALPGAAVRKANLLKLHDRAIQFEGFVSSRGAVSLRRFVEFVEQLKKAGVDWSSAEPHDTDDNAVRITSVHKSKGLEYPVVFLAELNSPYSHKDTTDPVLMDASLGLGLQCVELGTEARLDSLAHQVIAETKARQAVAEELRVLYVALTRARERLILCGCLKHAHCTEIIERRNVFEPVSLHDLRTHNHALAWLLMALADEPALQTALGLHDARADQSHVAVTLYDQAALNRLSDSVSQWSQTGRTVSAKESGDMTVEEVEQISRTLQWQYSHQALTTLPAKRTVSQLVHMDPLGVKNTFDPVRAHHTLKLNTHDKRTASAVGTATHLVLAHLDLSGPVTNQTVNDVIRDLIGRGVLDPNSAELIQATAIAAFFDTDLGRLTQAPTHQVYREWPFTLGLSLEELGAYGFDTVGPAQADEHIVVQGIADLVVATDEGLHLVDFKTDRIIAAQLPQRTEGYAQQLALYARAAQKILKKPVIGKWLHFLAMNQAVEVCV
ncbi:MAG: helicase-exonuclease AddAB subunit AddA [Planctomycetes bacterium]|nr:helicase-exonuclease AddAB subunit AddA [Planctomycetota bacterium]